MLDHHEIAIKILPGTVDRFKIRPGEQDRSVCSSVDGSAKFIEELHAMMRLTRPLGG
jgi:hypothetical protein